MADPKLKLGNDIWATKQKSLLAYNDEGGNYKSLPFQVDRISSGTYVGRNGLIQTAASNEPRVDFTSNTKGALLLEPQRTNYLLNSNDASQWSTLISNGTITRDDNYSIAPDGTLTATRLQASVTGSGYALLFPRTLTLTSGSYSLSVYVKSNTGSNQEVAFYGLNTTVTNYTITDEWQRLELTGTASGQAYILLGILTDNAGYTNPIDVSVWGGQIEAGTYATSIIPTSSAAVTRVKDEVANGGNEFIFNDSEGVVFMDVEIPENSSEVKQSALCNGTTNEAVKILQLNSTTFRFEVVMSSGTNFSQDITVNPYQRNKLALQYKANEYKVFVNGIKQTVTQRSTLPSGLDVYNFNRGFSTSDNFSGLINALKVFNTSLSDSELATLTTL